MCQGAEGPEECPRPFSRVMRFRCGAAWTSGVSKACRCEMLRHGRSSLDGRRQVVVARILYTICIMPEYLIIAVGLQVHSGVFRDPSSWDAFGASVCGRRMFCGGPRVPAQ